MMFVPIIWIVCFLCFTTANQDTCTRHIKFTTELEGSALQNHVIKNLTLPTDSEKPCRVQCVMESRCVSINIGQPINDRVVCQLSDSDHASHPEDIKSREGFTYTGTENSCSSDPCFHNGTCLNGFTEKRYLCVCQTGYYGVNCEKVTQTWPGDGNVGLIGQFLPTNQEATTCKELYEKNLTERDRAYNLTFESVKFPVYCHMTDDLGACTGGGWTLVMKMDGNKRTFHYDSNFWSNKELYNFPGGETGFDGNETKLPTYWNTPFSKICLGIKIGHQKHFIVINKQANSLYSLIADQQFRATSLGRNTWKSIIGSHGSLQRHCNKEGFNAICGGVHFSKARIGILGNNENHCSSCDSRIGFGTGGHPDDTNTCGVLSNKGGDNGAKDIRPMGYIFVQ